MTVRRDVQAGRIRPDILKLANENKLIENCFKEFCGAVYPDASPAQIKELRTCFFTGAAELSTILMYSALPEMDTTENEMRFLNGVTGELEKFHQQKIDAASAELKLA